MKLMVTSQTFSGMKG